MAEDAAETGGSESARHYYFNSTIHRPNLQTDCSQSGPGWKV